MSMIFIADMWAQKGCMIIAVEKKNASFSWGFQHNNLLAMSKVSIDTKHAKINCAVKIPSFVSPFYYLHRQGVDNRGMKRRDNIQATYLVPLNVVCLFLLHHRDMISDFIISDT